MQDFENSNSRNLELDRDIIVKLTQFLKTYPADQQYDVDKGHYMALTWLRDFIKHFEIDYNLWQEDCKDLLDAQSDELSDESRQIKRD